MLYVYKLSDMRSLSVDVERCELELAAAFCRHCAFASVNHLGEIVARNGAGTGSTVGKIKLRTKCLTTTYY